MSGVICLGRCIDLKSKILRLEKAVDIRRRFAEDGGCFVFTNGCFDLLHPGHIKLLKLAAELGDYLMVAVNSDASIRRLKGDTRPILSQDARLALLSGFQMVDGIIVFDDDTPVHLVKVMKPDIYVKGRGYRREEVPEADVVLSYGGRVVFPGSLDDYSTSDIIKKIRSLPAELF